MGGEVRHNGGGGPPRCRGRVATMGGRTATTGGQVHHDGGEGGSAKRRDGGWGCRRHRGRCNCRPNHDVAFAHSGMIGRGVRKKRRASPGCLDGKKADSTCCTAVGILRSTFFVSFPVIEWELSGTSIHATSCALDLVFARSRARFPSLLTDQLYSPVSEPSWRGHDVRANAASGSSPANVIKVG